MFVLIGTSGAEEMRKFEKSENFHVRAVMREINLYNLFLSFKTQAPQPPPINFLIKNQKVPDMFRKYTNI